ncbi:MAG TPA: 30S ribosomal protein S18 [Thermodesulfobacteriota bacterium]|nr:30S ribosomal protein S18 [Thermodesulfobacteriota bacterium]
MTRPAPRPGGRPGYGGARPGERPGRPGGDASRRPFGRKKVCAYCKNKELFIDYKDARVLRQFISERGKITPRRISGACARHQREIAIALKRARNLALLPFASSRFEE